jgi:transcriptional regulator with XRE-family HTH domain
MTSDPGLNAFATALRRAMAGSQVTVGEVADRMGVSRQAVTAWRSAKSVPARQRLVELEGVVGAPNGTLTAALYGGDQRLPPKPAGYDAVIATLPEHVRRTIDDIIDTYKDGRSS